MSALSIPLPIDGIGDDYSLALIELIPDIASLLTIVFFFISVFVRFNSSVLMLIISATLFRFSLSPFYITRLRKRYYDLLSRQNVSIFC